MTTYSSDSFNRTDNASSVGTTDGAGTLDPLTWTTQTGTCGINSNQGYASAFDGGGRAIATVDIANADVDISLTLAIIGVAGLAVVFRFSNTSNYWIWFSNGGVAGLYKNVSGSFTQIGGNHSGGANGDVFRVVAKGSSVTVYRNGTQLQTTTDSFNSTQTQHGFYSSDASARFDSWSATSAPTATTNQTLTATQTQTPTLRKLITKATTTLSRTQTQTPTIGNRSVQKILTVTQTQTATLTPLAGIGTTPTGSETSPTYAIKVVDMVGTVGSTLTRAEPDKVTWALNQPDSFEFHFPKGAYTNAQVASLAVGSTVTEAQIYRNGDLLTWGPIVQLKAGGKDGAVEASGKGVDWYLNRRFLDGTIVNKITNSDFETDFSSWSQTGSLTKTNSTSQFVTGTKSAKLVATSTGENYISQIIFADGLAEGVYIIVSGWFFIESFSGPGSNFHGLYMDGFKADGLVYRGNNYYPIDSATPRGQWVKATTAMSVPKGEQWFIGVRLYGINGTIYWDDVKTVAEYGVPIQGAQTSPGVFADIDVSLAIQKLVSHVQDSSAAAADKSDVHIGFRGTTTGKVTGRGGTGYLFADHVQFDTALREYIERSDGIDYHIEYTPTTRTFVQSQHKRGTDRHASVTLKYVAGDTSSNCVDYDFTQDAGQCITRQTVLGEDQGPDREQGVTKDTSNVAGIVLEDVRQAPQGTKVASLQFIANQRIAIFAQIPRVITMHTKGSLGLYSQIAPGDLVTVLITDGYVSVNETFRVQQMELDCKTNMLAVTVAKDDLS